MPSPQSAVVTALLAALTAFGPISTDLYLPSLPALRTAFGADVGATQLTLSVFLVGFAAGQLVYGPLSDRFGRRPVLLAGLSIYLLASIVCMLSPSIEALIAARFLQAIGAGAGVVLGRAVVRDVYEPRRAARVLALLGSAMAVAPLVGPILGGYLQVAFGWRANFACLVAFGAVGLLGAWTLLGETNRRMDPTATAPRRLLANYASLLAHRAYRGYALSIVTGFSGLFAFISASSFVLIDWLRVAPDQYGYCFGAVVLGYMAGSLVAARLTLRLGIDRMVAIGAAIILCAGSVMAALAFAHAFESGLAGIAAIVAPMSAYMFGMGLLLPNSIAGAVGPFPHMAGAAAALAGFLQMSGGALVGVAVGQLHSGTQMTMTTTIGAMGLATFLIWLFLVRPAANDASQAAA